MAVNTRHLAANAIDWYLNKVNEAHLIPVNLATLIRDLSAKQIGGEGFRPRPLTVANFTDAELDAIRTLAEKSKNGKDVDYTSYVDAGLGRRIAGKKLTRYLSPLNAIRTTLGQFTVSPSGQGKVVNDTYDFNTEKWKALDHGDGTVSFRNWNWDGGIERLPKKVVEAILSRRRDGAYGLIRQNAANYGHTDKDPDSEKIQARIGIGDIERRLGDKAGKFDLSMTPSDSDFRWRSAGAGAAFGAPAGAALGALSGAIRLLDKKSRKKWFRTMLSHILGGAAIGAATGGVGSWLASGEALKRFNSNEQNEKDGSAEGPAKRKPGGDSDFRSKVVKALSYAIPAVALAGGAAYGASQLNRLRDRLLNPDQDLYTMKDKTIEWVDSIRKL